MNLIDRIIAAVSPSAALKREMTRGKAAALSDARMAYDGATRGRRAQGWRVVSTDANAENLPALGRLRDVARDMVRNNPYAARAKSALKNNIVGPGIFPSVEAKNRKIRTLLEDLIKRHFDTSACDAHGQSDLYGLEALVMGTVAEAGEALVRRRWRRAEDGLALPFQIEVLEPDFLDTSRDGPLPNGGFIIQGIQFTPFGRREGYWIFSEHPGAASMRATNFESKFVPAADIAHIYRVDRPGQVRGVTWFAPVILKMRDLADYADAQLVRQKVAACFAAFVTSEDDVTGGGDAVKDADAGSPYLVEELQPGIIQRLKTGEDVTFGTPPSVGEYGAYKRAELQEVAVGLGMSYEALSGDLNGVNFSSGRMGWLEFQRTIAAAQYHMLLPQLCDPLGRWFLEAAALMLGAVVLDAKLRWTPSPREMINPAEEIKAAVGAMRSGLSSRPGEQRKLGHHPEDLDQEIAAANKRADKLGLVFDSDPRRVTSTGNAVALGGETPKPTGEEGDA